MHAVRGGEACGAVLVVAALQRVRARADVRYAGPRQGAGRCEQHRIGEAQQRARREPRGVARAVRPQGGAAPALRELARELARLGAMDPRERMRSPCVVDDEDAGRRLARRSHGARIAQIRQAGAAAGSSGSGIPARDKHRTPPAQRRWTLRRGGRIVASLTAEVFMRAIAMLVAAFPVAVLAQYIPQPVIPQTSVPGAGYSGSYQQAPGVGVGVVAPLQGGGAVIVGPGQARGYIVTDRNPWGTGVIGPGGAATYVVPNAGGSTILSPGGTTIVRPNPAGGTTIIGPNQPTTLFVPTERGGSVILGPGGTGYIVPTPQGTYVQPPANPPLIIYDR
ncbi:MAG: hypothetical protein KJ025_05400 [Burkholderiales bacterium]|nr:hypothetical protein [Burkholderiales bacterium]